MQMRNHLLTVVFSDKFFSCCCNPLILSLEILQVCLVMYLFLLDGSLNGEGDDFISTWDEVHETFDVMGLHENLLRGIYAYGTGLFSKN